jgi:hypothetical protein
MNSRCSRPTIFVEAPTVGGARAGSPAPATASVLSSCVSEKLILVVLLVGSPRNFETPTSDYHLWRALSRARRLGLDTEKGSAKLPAVVHRGAVLSAAFVAVLVGTAGAALAHGVGGGRV